MPKLNQLIGVGFCSGYGDRDYEVSCAVGHLDRKQFDELRLAMLDALRCAEQMWSRYHPHESQASKAEEPK